MSEANKAIMRAVTDMFNGKGDLSKVADFIAAGSIDHQGIPGVDTSGPEGFKRVVAIYRGAFPDLNAAEVSIAAEGDLVFAHFHMTGTNTGDFMGMPATGKSVDIEGVDAIRVANGKAVEHWGYLEEQKMMQQLGLMPAPGS